MREIKFRAWITPWGNAEPSAYMKCIDHLELHIYIGNWARGGYKNAVFQQYTGLTDCKGKEIYEGDILKNEGHFAYGVVSFTEAKFIVSLKDSMICYDLYELFDGLYQENYPGVVGNIFENPTLITDK